MAGNDRPTRHALHAGLVKPGSLREQQTMPPDSLHKFASGAVRSTDADAYRYDLVTPIGLRRVAEAYAEGAANPNYGDFNWEKGMPVHDLLNHALRHLYLYLSGDRTEDHLGHAAWNVMGACHSEELWPELNAGRLRQPGCRPPEVMQNAVGCLQ